MKITVTQKAEFGGKSLTRSASADLDIATKVKFLTPPGVHPLVDGESEGFPEEEIRIISNALLRGLEVSEFREEKEK